MDGWMKKRRGEERKSERDEIRNGSEKKGRKSIFRGCIGGSGEERKKGQPHAVS